jgi:hypothetical protein
MVKIETFNLNEDLQQDYDDADDLELSYNFMLMVGKISMPNWSFTFKCIVTLNNLDETKNTWEV